MKKHVKTIAMGLLALTMVLPTTGCRRIEAPDDAAEEPRTEIGTAAEPVREEIEGAAHEAQAGEAASTPAPAPIEEEPSAGPEDEPSAEAQPLEVTIERIDHSILDDEGNTLIEIWYELPSVVMEGELGDKINTVLHADHDGYVAYMEEESTQEYLNMTAEYLGGSAQLSEKTASEVTQNSDGILSIRHYSLSVMGGAHPLAVTYGDTVDTVTGDRVVLSEYALDGVRLDRGAVTANVPQYFADLGIESYDIYDKESSPDTLDWYVEDGQVILCARDGEFAGGYADYHEIETGLYLCGDACNLEWIGAPEDAAPDAEEDAAAEKDASWEIYRPILEGAAAYDDSYYESSAVVLRDLDGDGTEELLVLYTSGEEPWMYVNVGLYGSDGEGGCRALYEDEANIAGGASFVAALITLEDGEYLGICRSNYDGGEVRKWALLELESGTFEVAHTVEYYTYDDFSGDEYVTVGWGWFGDEELTSEAYDEMMDEIVPLAGLGVDTVTATELLAG